MRLLGVLLAGLLMAASACGSEPSDRPSSTASIRIAAPLPGEEITGETFEVRVELEGGRLTHEVVRDIDLLTPDEGHLHASLDGRIVSETFELSSEVPTPEPGQHLLQVEFVAKDHLPFDPRVLTSVTFSVPEQ
jgi:hypothetical protein